MTHLYQRRGVSRSARVGLLLLAAGPFAAIVHAEDYAKSFNVSDRAHVRVATNDGSVSITTGEAKEVEFHVEYKGYELNRTLHLDAHQQGDEIELTARAVDRVHFSLGATANLHIEVRMPKNADLQVETGDGSIKAAGLSGTIDLRSGDGSLAVSSISGVVRLHTGDGSIEGSNLDGRCEAASGDGRIRLSGRFDIVSAKSADGSIEVGARRGSKLESGWYIDSADGAIEVALPNDLPVDIDASSADGQIRSDIPIAVDSSISKSRIHGKMNGGGQTLTIHSGDGAIRLKQV